MGAVDFENKVKEENITDLYSFLDTLYSEGIKRNVFLLSSNREIKNLALLPLIDSYSIDTELCDFLFETGSAYKKCS